MLAGESSSSSYQDTLQKAISHLRNSDAAGVAYQKMLSSFAAECDILVKRLAIYFMDFL